MDYLTTHTSLSPISRGFALGFVKCKKGALDSQPQMMKFTSCLPMHGRWFSPATPASSTTKSGRHDIAEILLKVALNTIKSINQSIKFWISLIYFTELTSGITVSTKMDIISRRGLQPAAEKVGPTSMSRVPSRMRKTMYNEWVFFQLRIECIFWEYYWRVKAWTEAHFV